MRETDIIDIPGDHFLRQTEQQIGRLVTGLALGYLAIGLVLVALA